ncbi:MAG: oligosaccharide flippase family protein, partial [Acidobacteriota bacterium]
KYGRPAPIFDRQEWGIILRESLPMGLSAVFGVVMFNFDMVLLGFLKPASDVGAYSAAYRFINFFAAFVHLYAINLLPVIARYRSDPAGLGRLADQAMRYTLALAIPLAAGGTLLAKPLIVLIFGTEFAHGSISLQILLWIIPLITLRTIFRNVLVSHGLQRQLLGCMSLAAGVNIALNLLLIPRYSFVGAAAATLAAESILLLSLTRQVSRKVTRLLIGTHVWKPAAASLPMVLFLVWFRTEGIVGRIAAGGLLYLAFAWAAGAYQFGEIRELLRVRPAEKERDQ